MTPKEDPEVVAARKKERLMAQREQSDANEKLARGLTSDYNRTYGSGFSLFNMMRPK